MAEESQHFFAAELVQPHVLQLHVAKHGYFGIDVLPGTLFMVCLLLFLEPKLDKVLIWILEVVPELLCPLLSNSRNPGAVSNVMHMDHSCFCSFLVNARCFLPFQSPRIRKKKRDVVTIPVALALL